MKHVQVVHAVIKKDKTFLLGKRSLSKKNEPGFWAFIGGRLEPAESLEAALIRECSEEIDVVVKPVKKIMEILEQDSSHFWFEVEIVSGIPKLANDEHSEIGWFTKKEAEAISLIVAEDLQIIQASS